MKVGVYIKLDKDVQVGAQKLAAQLGFSLSTLINAQLKQFIRSRKLVLELYPSKESFLELKGQLALAKKNESPRA